MRARHYMYRGETRTSAAFVTVTSHFTCFYRPELIACLVRHGDQDRITMARARCDPRRAEKPDTRSK